MKDKYFVVINPKDFKYLSLVEQQDLGLMIERIENGRKKDGKKVNKYLVVNKDEPYASNVWRMIKEGVYNV